MISLLILPKVIRFSGYYFYAEINIISYKMSISTTFFASIFCSKVTLWQLFLAKKALSYEKNAQKMLMELTLGGQFHHHFTLAFFIQKCFAQLFSSYSLALNFFCKRMLAQKLHVKC
jgi:hypothetical protein